MAKTLVIFDIDGTLLYSNKIDSQCFAQTYQTIYGFDFPTIDWTKYPHVTDTTIFKTVIRQHFERDVTTNEVGEFQHHYVGLLEEGRRKSPNEFLEVPNAKFTIERLLEDERFVVGIGTGGWARPAQVKLAHIGISTTTICLVGADGHEQREGIIEQVMQTVAKSHEVSRTVYVGDAIWDVDTTRRMNLDFVGVRRAGDFEVLKNAGASLVLKDYTNYGHFLRAIWRAKPPK